jgi:hypothetical protein
VDPEKTIEKNEAKKDFLSKAQLVANWEGKVSTVIFEENFSVQDIWDF